MIEPGRKYSAGDGYRYGFNGKENDNEVKGEGLQLDYGFRIYDTRIGRFLSVDPLFKSYPWYTPYQFAGNMPIWAIDLDGLEDKKATAVDITRIFKDGVIVSELKDSRGTVYKSSANILSQGDEGGGYQVTYHDYNFYGPYGGYIRSITYTEFQQEIPPGINQIVPVPPVKQVPKTNLQQDNDDDHRPTGTTTVITPINNTRLQNQTLTRNIDFVSGKPEFLTDADRQMVNDVAQNAPNRTTNGRPTTTTNGNTTTTTQTTLRVRSIITIDLLTDRLEDAGSKTLLTNRYNLIRDQLIKAGIPATNIRRGRTVFDSPEAHATKTGNQTIFRIRTTRTRTTTGNRTTTTKTDE
jgi:RHS repeat-associated protein